MLPLHYSASLVDKSDDKKYYNFLIGNCQYAFCHIWFLSHDLTNGLNNSFANNGFPRCRRPTILYPPLGRWETCYRLLTSPGTRLVIQQQTWNPVVKLWVKTIERRTPQEICIFILNQSCVHFKAKSSKTFIYFLMFVQFYSTNVI